MENKVSNIRIDVSVMIDHAVRICGFPTGEIPPEIIQYSKENLKFVLLELSNRGTPIWTTTRQFLGLQPLKWQYNLPTNVLDIFDINWRTMSHYPTTNTGGTDPEYLTDYDWYSFATTTSNFKVELNNAYYIDYCGFAFYGEQENTISIEVSPDNINWTIVKTFPKTTYSDGEWVWFDFDTPILSTYARISISNGQTLSLRAFFIGYTGNGREIPIAKMNRDDFFAYPSKGRLGTPINYYFQKTTTPVLMFWQSANVQNAFNWSIHYYQQTTVDQFINLPNTIDIPAWIMEAAIWKLASRVAYQLPPDKINAERRMEIKAMAEELLQNAEASYSDTSNINLLGAIISSYTR